MIFSQASRAYKLLNDQDRQTDAETGSPTPSACRTTLQGLIFTIAVLASGVLGFISGAQKARFTISNNDPTLHLQREMPVSIFRIDSTQALTISAPLGRHDVFLEYNTTFSYRPTEESAAAWRALFPSMPSTTTQCP